MPTRPFLELESSPFFRATLWKRTGYLVLALVLNLVVLTVLAALNVSTNPHEHSMEFLGYHIWFAFGEWYTYAWLVAILAVQVILAHWSFHKMLEHEGMIQLYPIDKTGGRTFAGLSADELVQMVHEMAERIGVGRIRRIVVNDRPDPNAYTASILGLGNIVVLHSNLIDILPPEGVRAIVAHEVGHIRRKDSLMYMVLGFPQAFIRMMGVFILLKIGLGIFHFDQGLLVLIQRIVFLAGTYSLAIGVLTRLTRITNLASQQSEHLADACAAVAVGVESTINALLFVGERAEALTVLQETLAKQPHLVRGISGEELLRVLRRFPPAELSKDKAKHVASRLYIESRLAELQEALCVPISDDEIIELAKHADAQLKKRQKAESSLSPQEQAERERAEQEKQREEDTLLINWRRYDRDRSGHLDLYETARMVQDLREQPQKMIFRQFLDADARWQSHPTMRDRVLYLFDAFKPQGK